MILKEAIAKMEEGQAIKLPEWGGFWFMAGKVIYVFTKEHEFFNTPHIEKYGRQEDWYTTGVAESHAVPFCKALRVRIDAFMKLVERHVYNCREKSLVLTEAQLGFMLIGKFLGDLGAEYPYPESYDSTSSVIEKHVDLAPEIRAFHEIFNPKRIADEGTEVVSPTQTAYVKALRSEISTLSDLLSFAIHSFPVDIKIARGHSKAALAYDRLMNANMWLGQVLNNIREQQEREKAIEEKYLATIRQTGQESYERYAAHADWKNFSGGPIPQWSEVSELIQSHWYAAVEPLVYDPRRNGCCSENMSKSSSY